MTMGYYAIPPSRPVHGPKRTAPWPYCRTCVTARGCEPVAPITDAMAPSLTCRGCHRKLRAWA